MNWIISSKPLIFYIYVNLLAYFFLWTQYMWFEVFAHVYPYWCLLGNGWEWGNWMIIDTLW